eukprot:RCo011138
MASGLLARLLPWKRKADEEVPTPSSAVASPRRYYRRIPPTTFRLRVIPQPNDTIMIVPEQDNVSISVVSTQEEAGEGEGTGAEVAPRELFPPTPFDDPARPSLSAADSAAPQLTISAPVSRAAELAEASAAPTGCPLSCPSCGA